MEAGDILTLLKNFTFVGDAGRPWTTDRIHFPAGHRRAQLAVLTKSRIGASVVQVRLQTTFDTDTVTSVGGATPTPAPGVATFVDIGTGLGPLVRLQLTAGGADTQVVFSVFLTPKVS